MPVYFIDWCLFAGIGMDEWIGNVHFVCATDTFDGLHPQLMAPQNFPYNHKHASEQINNTLLAHPEVKDYIRSRGGGKALFWMLDQETERLAAALGLDICLPPVALRHFWDHKGNTNRMAEKAGVPCVPYLLSALDSYDHLRKISLHLGERLVLQAPYGNSGSTTFFIAEQSDFDRHKKVLTNGEEIRIMRHIDCRSAGLEACVTRFGTVVTPLMSELVGLPEITISRGGWCGNEIYAGIFPDHISRLASEYTLKMGEQLRRVGYRGYFQLDFLIDRADGVLYLGEMNPRLSGITPLVNNAPCCRHTVPLLLIHLAEWMHPDCRLPVDALNEYLMDQSNQGALSFLHVNNVQATTAVAPRSGIYRKAPDGRISFLRPAIRPGELTTDDEVFWFRTAARDTRIGRGEEIGALFLRQRATEENGQLTATAKEWIAGICAPAGGVAAAGGRLPEYTSLKPRA